MKCKGCGEARKLIKAHIIPRSFYMDLRDRAGYLNVVPSESTHRIARSNIGDYDIGILCQDCDQYLAIFDDYGKQVLIDRVHPLEEISKAGAVAGWTIQGCDPVRLEKFFLSVLWRASISSRKFFLKVKLGPYERELRDYLWGEANHHRSLGCVISKFRVSRRTPGAEKTILDPDRFKYGDRNYYRLYLGGYIIWIRVDGRRPIDSIGACELAPDRPCIIVNRSFDDSKEFQAIHKSVLAHGWKK